MNPEIALALAAHGVLNGGDRRAEATGTDPVTPGADVALPPPVDTLDARLTDVLHARRAHYRFAERPLDPGVLSTLLRLAAGGQRTVTLPDGRLHRMRMNPSAGGLRSITVHVVAGPGRLVPAGVHRHVDGALVVVRAGDPLPALRAALVQPEFADRAAVTLVLVGDLAATMPRYPARHYRTLHVDAGILAQNLWLVATALDLACCAVSGFQDEPLAALLALPATSIPILALPLGHRH
ncbi:SagB family peptide dehydrogenase [Pseudonocardia pini]|uniref:SagB family peptide dehydrogenase n=1 Tax=Pseudonocardia pini TaxID=2758030 RepID=UPI0015F0ABF4|nr:SagB family peptide dehydrogenase [Pseudonocardia pini]